MRRRNGQQLLTQHQKTLKNCFFQVRNLIVLRPLVFLSGTINLKYDRLAKIYSSASPHRVFSA